LAPQKNNFNLALDRVQSASFLKIKKRFDALQ